MKTRAAILARSREPLIVDEIDTPPLGVGQVLVKILYSTICGAQLNEIAAVKGPDKFLPHLLGHEASAAVAETGLGVTQVKQGDQVVLHWRPSLGIQSAPPVYSWGGEKLNAGWVTTFQDYAVIAENRMTRIPPVIDMRVAPLLGCALTTALGVVNNDARIKLGDSVLVIGCGGVGLPIIQMAALAGAYPITAVDIHDDKLRMARSAGATEWRKPGRVFLGNAAFDKVIETTGTKANIELAYESSKPQGRCVLVGVPSEKVQLATLPLHFGKVLIGSHGGDSRPHEDIPRLLNLVEAKKLSLDGLITHEFPLEKINEALDTVRGGHAGRVVIR